MLEPRLSALEAVRVLMAGNRRFVVGRAVHTEHTARRESLVGGQHPLAMILSCSDSRVPPEIVFDQGLGDLFVVRLAGNFADPDGIGSMEYALAHFSPSLLVVLGHSGCGAIAATVDALTANVVDAPGHVADIIHALSPAARVAMGQPGDAYSNAVVENVRENVRTLKRTGPVLDRAVTNQTLRVVGAVYALKTGRVSIV